MEMNMMDNIDNMLVAGLNAEQIQPPVADLDFLVTVKKEEAEPEIDGDVTADKAIKSLRDKLKFETDDNDYLFRGLEGYVKNEDSNNVASDLEDLQSTENQDTDIPSAHFPSLRNNFADKLATFQNFRNEAPSFTEIENRRNYHLADHNYALITEHEDSTTDTCSEFSLEGGNSSTDTADSYSAFSFQKDEQNISNLPNYSQNLLENGFKIYLEDWGPTLDRSSRFCKDCKTLFLTEDSLNAHNISNHIYFKATASESRNRNRSARNTKNYTQHKRSTSKTKLKKIDSTKESSNAKSNLFRCNSCDIYYMSESALDRHVACSHVKGKIETCDLCGLRFSIRCLPFHYRLHHSKKVQYHETYSIKGNSGKTRKSEMSATQNNEDKNSCEDDTTKIEPARSLRNIKNSEQQKCSIRKNGSSRKSKKSNLDIREKNSIKNTKKKNGLARPLELDENAGKKKFDEENGSSRKNRKKEITVPKDKTNKPINNGNEKIQRTRLPDNVLYKCSACSVCFWHIRILKHHNHNVVKLRKCSICGLTFSTYALSAHIAFHHDQLSLKLEDFEIREYTMDVTDETSQNIEKIEPKLLEIDNITKEYQTRRLQRETRVKRTAALKKNRKASLFRKFIHKKILYKCAKCNCCYLKKSTFKRHISCCSNMSGNVTKCTQCGYTFTRKSLAQHVVIHHDQMKLNREDFYIRISMLTLSNAEVEELDQANSKKIKDADPDERIEIAKLLYANKGKSVTETHRPSDNVLYRCDDCLMCYWNILTARNHNHYREIKSRKCCLCGLIFTRSLLLPHVVYHHEKQKLNLEDFEIRKIKDVKKNFYGAMSKVSKEHCKTLFMCTKCKCCFLNERYLPSHNCKRKRLKKCEHCSYRFKPQTLLRHVKLHHKKNKFERKDFIVCKISPKQHSVIGNSDSDSEINSANEESSKSERNKRKETDNLDSDCSTDFDSEKNTAIVNKKFPRCPIGKVLYKCKTCSVCFLRLNTTKQHIHDGRVESLKCSICGLLFTKRIIRIHKAIQHDKLKIGIEDFEITYFSTKDSVSEDMRIETHKKRNASDTSITGKPKTKDKELKCSDSKETERIDKNVLNNDNKKIGMKRKGRRRKRTVKLRNSKPQNTKESSESESEQENSCEETRKKYNTRSRNSKPEIIADRTEELGKFESLSGKVNDVDCLTNNSTPKEAMDSSEIQSEAEQIDIFKCTPDEVYKLLCASGKRQKL